MLKGKFISNTPAKKAVAQMVNNKLNILDILKSQNRRKYSFLRKSSSSMTSDPAGTLADKATSGDQSVAASTSPTTDLSKRRIVM